MVALCVRVLKHETVKKVTLVDIDEEVIKASKTFFPAVSCALDDTMRGDKANGCPFVRKGTF